MLALVTALAHIICSNGERIWFRLGQHISGWAWVYLIYEGFLTKIHRWDPVWWVGYAAVVAGALLMRTDPQYEPKPRPYFYAGVGMYYLFLLGFLVYIEVQTSGY